MNRQRNITELKGAEFLLGFLKENHHIPKTYLKRYYRKETALCNNAREKLRTLFIFALNASNAGSNLDKGAETVKDFSNKISSIGTSSKVSFVELCDIVMENKCTSSNKGTLVYDFYTHLKHYKQIGHKKSAMFLRDVLYIGGNDLFTDVNVDDWFQSLIIPVDRVVRLLLTKYFNLPTSNDEDLSIGIRNNLPDKHMYFEDLWFWGHFALKKEEIQNPSGNSQMITMDPILDYGLEQVIRDTLPKFIKVIHKTSIHS